MTRRGVPQPSVGSEAMLPGLSPKSQPRTGSRPRIRPKPPAASAPIRWLNLLDDLETPSAPVDSTNSAMRPCRSSSPSSRSRMRSLSVPLQNPTRSPHPILVVHVSNDVGLFDCSGMSPRASQRLPTLLVSPGLQLAHSQEDQYSRLLWLRGGSQLKTGCSVNARSRHHPARLDSDPP
jgi:hypothetical protein